MYGLFALSASSRGIVELATKFHTAPLSYFLSTLSGLIYIVGTVCLTRSTRLSRQIGIASFAIELLGVIAVGAWTLVDRSAFRQPTVWSDFGFQYWFVPLAMPIFGLWWLWRGSRWQPETDDVVSDSSPTVG